jgi:hypothetical protein
MCMHRNKKKPRFSVAFFMDCFQKNTLFHPVNMQENAAVFFVPFQEHAALAEI